MSVVWVAVSSNPGGFGVVGECPDRGGAAGVDAGVAVLRAIDDEAVLSASRALVRRVGDRDGGGHDAPSSRGCRGEGLDAVGPEA